MCLRILVVDDEKLIGETTAFQLTQAGHCAEAHLNAFTALKSLSEKGPWDVVLTDLRMPHKDGLQFLKEIKARSPSTDVIVMTAYGNVKTAVQAMRDGALDYLSKPFNFEELNLRLDRSAEFKRVRDENTSLRETLKSARTPGGFVGNSEKMRRSYDLIQQFAAQPSNVLIIGETGTGKELAARAIHALSPRSKGPFVALGCTTVPRELAESELFGHEAGSFTGAGRRHTGRIEQAAKGTFFLDDVDDMPLEIQAKLLRVIEERQFERVGGEKPVSADVRIVAASKFDLESLVKAGKFREDLMYRLSVLVIPLAPLRERREDIPLLARHFLDTFAQERSEEPKAISPDALEHLLGYAWPGNVRELRHAVEYGLALSRGLVVSAAELPPKLQQMSRSKLYALNLGGISEIDFKALSEEFERDLIAWAFDKAEGSQVKAAQILGIPRSTLQFKSKQQTRA